MKGLRLNFFAVFMGLICAVVLYFSLTMIFYFLRESNIVQFVNSSDHFIITIISIIVCGILIGMNINIVVNVPKVKAVIECDSKSKYIIIALCIVSLVMIVREWGKGNYVGIILLILIEIAFIFSAIIKFKFKDGIYDNKLLYNQTITPLEKIISYNIENKTVEIQVKKNTLQFNYIDKIKFQVNKVDGNLEEILSNYIVLDN